MTFYITPTVYLLGRSIHKYRALLILSILYNQNLNKEGYTRDGQSSVVHILIGAQIEDQLVQIEDQLVLCNKQIYRIGFAKYLISTKIEYRNIGLSILTTILV